MYDIQLGWLIKLRWVATFGQSTTILVATLLYDLPVRQWPRWLLVLLVLATVATNLLATWWARRDVQVSERPIVLLLALDIAILSGMLFFSGGPSNPFSVLYLVHVTLAAIMLRPAWTWLLVLFSVVAFGILFWFHVPLEGAGHTAAHGGGDAFAVHLRGMWVAFSTAAAVIAAFVVQLSRALRQREEELHAARRVAEHHERLASLATLAAGAAHELSTPLATIAVAARELERSLPALVSGATTSQTDDARLIRSEVDRCRRVLEQLASDAGTTSGEAPTEVTIAELLAEIEQHLGKAQWATLVVLPYDEKACLMLPKRAVALAVTNLLRNAIDASNGGQTVQLEVDNQADRIEITVVDQGCGMPPDLLARASEPFFTTKQAGQGLGLGLFLSLTVAEQLGGALDLHSSPGQGSRVVLSLPKEVRAREVR